MIFNLKQLKKNYIFHVIIFIGLLFLIISEKRIESWTGIKISQRVKEVIGATLILIGWYFYNNEKLF
jgi:hypothetical protein